MPILIIYSQKNKIPNIDNLIGKFSDNLYTNKDSALFYIKNAEEKSLQANNDYYLSRCFYNQGYFYTVYINNKKAIDLLSKTLIVAKKAKNYKIVIKSYNLLAFIYMDFGDFNKSSDYLIKGLKFAKLNNMPEQSLVLNSLGILFYKQKDTSNAIKYYQEAEKTALENNDKQQLLEIYNNLAVCQNKNETVKSIFYLKKALQIAYELKDINSQFDELINLSTKYLRTEDFRKAFGYITEAKKIALQLEDKTKLFYVYEILGSYYYKTNKPKEALKMNMQALQNSHNKDFEQRLTIYDDIATTYEKINNYKEALRYNKIHQQLKDSIFTIEKNKNFNEIVTKYEVEKKNDQIKLLNQQKEIDQKRRNIILIVSTFIILFLLSLAYFIFKRVQLQKKLRTEEEKNHLREKEKLIKDQELKEVKALINGQNEERNRIAKELHDGVAGDLAGIKFILNQENQNIQNENLIRVQSDLSSVFQEIRNISHNLSQNYTQNKSLKALLQDLQTSYRERSDISFDINIYPENATDNLDETKKQHLYRIFQELLQNALKHSQATEIELNINKNEELLNIIFEDNGVGFTAEDFKGIGLKNIEERLKIISAELTIDSYPGRGSTFIINIKNTNET